MLCPTPSPAGTCRTIRSEVTRVTLRAVSTRAPQAGREPPGSSRMGNATWRGPSYAGSSRIWTARRPISAKGRATEARRGRSHVAELGAVEGDDRDVVRHAQPVLGQRLVGAHRHPVVEADQPPGPDSRGQPAPRPRRTPASPPTCTTPCPPARDPPRSWPRRTPSSRAGPATTRSSGPRRRRRSPSSTPASSSAWPRPGHPSRRRASPTGGRRCGSTQFSSTTRVAEQVAGTVIGPTRRAWRR